MVKSSRFSTASSSTTLRSSVSPCLWSSGKKGAILVRTRIEFLMCM